MNGRKYLQILYLIRYEYTSKIHIKNSYNLIVRNSLILKCAEELKRPKKKNWKDIFPKKMYRWPTGTSVSLIRESQIKTTMRYHLMPVRMAVVKKTRDNKYWWKCGEKGTLVHWECKLVQSLWKTIWRFLKKKKNRTTIWSSNSTFGYVSRGNEITLEEISAPPCTL